MFRTGRGGGGHELALLVAPEMLVEVAFQRNLRNLGRGRDFAPVGIASAPAGRLSSQFAALIGNGEAPPVRCLGFEAAGHRDQVECFADWQGAGLRGLQHLAAILPAWPGPIGVDCANRSLQLRTGLREPFGTRSQGKAADEVPFGDVQRHIVEQRPRAAQAAGDAEITGSGDLWTLWIRIVDKRDS